MTEGLLANGFMSRLRERDGTDVADDEDHGSVAAEVVQPPLGEETEGQANVAARGKMESQAAKRGVGRRLPLFLVKAGDILTKEIIGRGTMREGLHYMDDFSSGRVNTVIASPTEAVVIHVEETGPTKEVVVTVASPTEAAIIHAEEAEAAIIHVEEAVVAKETMVTVASSPVANIGLSEEAEAEREQKLESPPDQQIMDQNDEVSLDINEIANSLREQLKIKKVFSPACCIYRVPEQLRKLNEEAYLDPLKYMNSVQILQILAEARNS
ncbi:hypothetical protein POTOM_014628 [Populus tomentosa]|uniref:Uncharacterized protein n=1 Tax=Populus tomentosa TaxID=118781 RepID=A0A8X8CZI5_POPTO|nr:hypothetical protein POTOM_014628 [Populus tomentosa]